VWHKPDADYREIVSSFSYFLLRSSPYRRLFRSLTQFYFYFYFSFIRKFKTRLCLIIIV